MTIEQAVVLAADVRPGVRRLVARMLRVDVPPEGVVKPVYADLHHHQEVRLLFLPDELRDHEVLFGHVDDVSVDATEVVGPNVLDIRSIGPKAFGELGFERARKAKRHVTARPHESRNEMATHGWRR